MVDLLLTERRSSAVGREAPASGRSSLRRHAGLAALLVAALTLRAVAVVAISPGIWFSDSNGYIAAAATGRLSVDRVDGYALFVAPFWRLGSAVGLVVVQHVVGVGLVALLYALLVRRGVSRGVALLAVVPAALDAYLVVVEHVIMAETVFHAALLGALALLLWGERPGVLAAASAGVLLGYAGVTRSVAIPFVAVAVLYLVARRVGWRRVVALGVGWAVVVVGYMTLFAAQHGSFVLTQSNGRFLYARVAPFADCAQLPDLPAAELAFCPDPAHRLPTNAYLWSGRSPIAGLPPSADARIADFARRVIRAQPLTYAGVVGAGVLHYFEPGHRIGANDYPVTPWQFPSDPRRWGYPGYRGPIRRGDPERHRRHPLTEPGPLVAAMVDRPRVDVGASRALHAYQRVAYTWGPLLAACVLLVVVALVARRGEWRARLDAALLAALVLAALLVTQAASLFSYRYGLIAPLLLPPAAALAWTAWPTTDRFRPRGAARAARSGSR